ncbi:unnamed protein product [Microthlaspi erraticum]|uniref:Uncharacterized protein n=1 Tax=Microthlaspi erraticum TaxID=1685480 RepID=A0A6D2LG15_9BRAS|nr:unnamed protein product [Microthlaspi erraticum]
MHKMANALKIKGRRELWWKLTPGSINNTKEEEKEEKVEQNTIQQKETYPKDVWRARTNQLPIRSFEQPQISQGAIKHKVFGAYGEGGTGGDDRR